MRLCISGCETCDYVLGTNWGQGFLDANVIIGVDDGLSTFDIDVFEVLLCHG